MENKEYNLVEELNKLRKELKNIPEEFHDLIYDVIFSAGLLQNKNIKLEKRIKELEHKLADALKRYYNLKWSKK